MYQDYKYLYETHLHTKRGSACARCTGEEMARAAKEYGYAGIIITEHNWGGNTAVSRDLPWEEWVDQFIVGYEEALAYGKEHDLDVFWGYEAGFDATEFLTYGVSPEWLKAHPELRTAGVKEHFEIVSAAGGFLVHAHPYREEWYIPEIRLYPEYAHAVEAINATHSNHKSTSHNDPAFDTKAIAYAKEHNFPMTAGSDVHSTNLFGGGVLFKKRLTSIQEYAELIRGGDYMLTNGDVIYDRFGNEVAKVN
ncbi:MAG: histidinol-phosphatase [Clostridiales bacterium]|nr:histidinol-phosphatase [Candidatus Blautia equi]